jgi:release factor glutamine methyltransferase
MLVEHFTGGRTEDIVCSPLLAVPADAVARLDSALTRRLAGEPIHRIFGWREFYGLTLSLSPETLEPRPDTETLVNAVLPFARERATATGSCRILDLGTGTGAIPLALLSSVATAIAVATDIAPGALATAHRNAKSLGLAARFTTLESNWFESVSGHFDLIVSNPPYIRSDVIPTLDREVREHDPLLALDGGTDGLDAYRAIAAGAPKHLAEGGLVAVEIGFDQTESASSLFQAAGFVIDQKHADLAGNDRVLLMKMRQ